MTLIIQHQIIRRLVHNELEMMWIEAVVNEIKKDYRYFFFGGEGARSRSYGCTAALRLIVQLCDEDD
jgi:hypothetical protein